MADVKCPRCGGLVLERMPRFGFVQLRLLPFFGLYPWRCVRCGKISYRSERANAQLEPPRY